MSISTSTIIFTHRFAGPCRAKGLLPYARPDIISIQITHTDGTMESIPHAILRFGYSSGDTVCLELKSDCDDELYGFWTGCRAELATLIHQEHQLRLWNIVLCMSARMTRILLDPNPFPV